VHTWGKRLEPWPRLLRYLQQRRCKSETQRGNGSLRFSSGELRNCLLQRSVDNHLCHSSSSALPLTRWRPRSRDTARPEVPRSHCPTRGPTQSTSPPITPPSHSTDGGWDEPVLRSPTIRRWLAAVEGALWWAQPSK
jgi:hypothetical protein